jgi:hypothetical protein
MHNPVEQTNDPTRTGVDGLRRLPTEMRPPYNWQEFQRRSKMRLPEARDSLGWRPMAVAAALLLIVWAIAVWGRLGNRVYVAPLANSNGEPSPDAPARIAEGQNQDTAGPGISSSARGAINDAALAAVRSRAIELWLATLPREPVVVRVGTRAAVTRLEDRIAQVDDLLTSVRLDGVRPDRLEVLQRERARLVGSLAQVRYAEVVASESP